MVGDQPREAPTENRAIDGTSSEPMASVVIPARNAANEIGQQLEALAQQENAERIEIVVVDNRSTDATAEVARSWQSRLPQLRVVAAFDRLGAAHARNVGVRAARADRILFCDADDIVGPDWADVMLEALESADGVTGRVIAWPGLGNVPAVPPPGSDVPTPKWRFLPGCSGGNCAVRRSAFEGVGGFDETLLAGEDADLAWRMQLAGLHFSNEARAVVFYRTRLSARGLFRQRYAYGKSHVRLFAKYEKRGMPRSSTIGAMKSWGKLIVTSYRLASADARREWLWAAGWRLGRVVGSVKERRLYL